MEDQIAAAFGAFSLFARMGGQYANATSGVIIGLAVSLPPMLAISWWIWKPEWWNLWAFVYFTLAGLVGPATSRVFLFLAIHRMGVARAMPLSSSTPLFASVLAFLFLSERPSPFIWAGTVAIVAGSAMLSYKKADDGSWERKYLWFSFLSAFGAGLSFFFRKLALQHVAAPVMGATLSSLAGLVFLLAFVPLLPADERPSHMKNQKAWLFYGACGFLNMLGFVLHFFAIGLGKLSIVAPLTSTAPLFTLVLSWIVLRRVERITPWLVAATLLMVTGAALIGLKLE